MTTQEKVERATEFGVLVIILAIFGFLYCLEPSSGPQPTEVPSAGAQAD